MSVVTPKTNFITLLADILDYLAIDERYSSRQLKVRIQAALHELEERP